MEVRTLVVGPLFTDCYILQDGGECAVVDPGGDARKIISAIEDSGCVLKTVILTHGHYDHVAAMGPVMKKYPNAELVYHKGDYDVREEIFAETAMFGFEGVLLPEASRFLKEGDVVGVGGAGCTVMHTPGHSPGSITLFDRVGERALVGDTLFQQGIGRSDLAGGDGRLLVRTIRERLYALDDGTRVLPGHGPATTIGSEKRHNPWVRA